ncbi:MAG: 1-deoxy-D-xylulose-5-phosphate reductoisomerase, partial [Firmicutes bacterium]|nr:1-deoxy-D-xylulose-5-phosphate reductoisomerase [Bacillota bacterium]
KAGGTMAACLNAANEVAVEHFLKGLLSFTDIPRLIENVMNAHTVMEKPEVEDLEKADLWARRSAVEQIARLTERS